ncbi:T-complex 10 C-terminal domain-containing protein [Streptomyces europaeiscabiei]|uniref:T-complex 10 C-terminal domain-containing protein n=1 Tax=Streptomyces europaeiscabiei TaxID=146819 RepID=UPI0029A7D1A6|nr:T-complex 10 C-terminal domain-containing protein [Streptomyces europaeiscabiei]MDX3688825.1 T-complex 10 C-terminal domain-containing protein [Streptomyces europaeiscabiei]
MADDTTPPTGASGTGWALARRADGLTSAIVGLYGWGDGPGAVVRAVGANAYGHHSATPVLEAPEGAGRRGPVLATLVLLSGDPRAPHTGASATVDADGDVDIRFPDGTRERVSRSELPYGTRSLPLPQGQRPK